MDIFFLSGPEKYRNRIQILLHIESSRDASLYFNQPGNREKIDKANK